MAKNEKQLNLITENLVKMPELTNLRLNLSRQSIWKKIIYRYIL